MPFASVNGVRLFFTDEGEGSACLFIHGLACDSHDWNWQLAEFAQNYRVIAPDLRGHGHSSAPDSAYRPEHFAQDLVELIDLLDCGPVVAIGHSLGGLVANVLAVEHPAYVSAVVAVDPALHLQPSMRESSGGPMQTEDSDEIAALIQGVFAHLDTADTPNHLKMLHARRVLSTPAHVIREARRTLFDQDSVWIRPNSAAYLKRRKCPAFSHFRDDDRAAAEAEVLRDRRSLVTAWTGAGHWFHQEQPDRFNEMVLQWIAELSSDPTD